MISFFTEIHRGLYFYHKRRLKYDHEFALSEAYSRMGYYIFGLAIGLFIIVASFVANVIMGGVQQERNPVAYLVSLAIVLFGGYLGKRWMQKRIEPIGPNDVYTEPEMKKYIKKYWLGVLGIFLYIMACAAIAILLQLFA